MSGRSVFWPVAASSSALAAVARSELGKYSQLPGHLVRVRRAAMNWAISGSEARQWRSECAVPAGLVPPRDPERCARAIQRNRARIRGPGADRRQCGRPRFPTQPHAAQGQGRRRRTVPADTRRRRPSQLASGLGLVVPAERAGIAVPFPERCRASPLVPTAQRCRGPFTEIDAGSGEAASLKSGDITWPLAAPAPTRLAGPSPRPS